ncbi:cysteine hydrolase family protein [Bacillus solimangrovi]|uniref:Isochorismatase n=1 Tax=Bacillus solimangrovi TaxID=1305675 RepID=A0A1E5LEQ5_9BACI|nr:isochorismatase family cysteine hydrolase [Bacillus solimangrovi]OEH92558.1 isochorismatase [Bacillus solimangrovi]
MSTRAWIVIDYTNDFVSADGALTCGEPAQEMEADITSLTEQAINDGDFVVFAVDVHKENDPYHPETKLYPPHNIAHTEGRLLFGTLESLYQRQRYAHNVYYMDKTRYSAFSGTDLEIKLRERGVTELHLLGVCTEICVLHTAIEAYNKGFDIVIHKNAVASFNEQGHEWALGHFKHALGAKVVE